MSPRRERESSGRSKSADLRSEFEKDYHRIIGSASFRRLQDKTQVFPLDKSDFIRTRLTHSLEVSSLGKSLGQNIGENILKFRRNSGFTPQMKEDISHILECAGLIHDIGNPPFGHFGEIAIREWFAGNLPELSFGGRRVEDMLSEQMKTGFLSFRGQCPGSPPCDETALSGGRARNESDICAAQHHYQISCSFHRNPYGQWEHQG